MSKRKAGERDFRDLKSPTENKPRDDRPANAGNERDWWNHSGARAAGIINSVIQILQKAQTQRMRQQVINARLYGNLQLGGASGAAYMRIQSSQFPGRERITYNAIQEIVDTLQARIGEAQPKPYNITNGGSYKQQRKAKKLNQFVDGVFYEAKAHDLSLEAFRDAEVWGDGFIHVFPRGGRVSMERVWGNELWVDEVEAQYGKPQNMSRLRVVDRNSLALAFPESKMRIMAASRAPEPGITQSTSDMVTTCETWHLAQPNDKGEMIGGKHAISLFAENHMLVEPEDWPYDFFPLARFPWCKRPMAYWSQGLCEQLQGDQIELNFELQMIQKSMRLASGFKLLLHHGSKVVKEHASNEVGAIIGWGGTHKPEYITTQPIDPVYFANAERIIERMRDRAGLSKMQTSGTKPAGELSGKALRTLEDVVSDRHRAIQRQYDAFSMELAGLCICVANEMSKAGQLEPVRVPGKTSFAVIDWKKDIKDVKTDEFVLKCLPVSSLTGSPSENLATIQEYIQAGFVTPRQGRRMLDFPDLQQSESLANAQEDMLSMVLDDIIDNGNYSPPEPTDDLQMAKEMCLEYLQKYRALDLEEEKLDMLRNFNAQIDAMLDKAAEMQAARATMMAPPPGAKPLAAPTAPPQSELLPNAPAVH